MSKRPSTPPKRPMSAIMADATVELLGESGITAVGVVGYIVALYSISVYFAFLVNPPAGVTITIFGMNFHSLWSYGIDLPNAEPILCIHGHYLLSYCNWTRLMVNIILFAQLVGVHAFMSSKWAQEKASFEIGKIHRSVYCIIGGVQLLCFCAMWQNDVSGIMLWEGVQWLVWPYGLALAFTLSSTFVDDHFALFGIKQSTGFDFYQALGVPKSSGLGVRWHALYIRHPMITGLVLMHFLTPSMSLEHLLLNVGVVAYGYVYVHYILEKDILDRNDAMSSEYKQYITEVDAFVPTQITAAAVTAAPYALIASSIVFGSFSLVAAYLEQMPISLALMGMAIASAAWGLHGRAANDSKQAVATSPNQATSSPEQPSKSLTMV